MSQNTHLRFIKITSTLINLELMKAYSSLFVLVIFNSLFNSYCRSETQHFSLYVLPYNAYQCAPHS